MNKKFLSGSTVWLVIGIVAVTGLMLVGLVYVTAPESPSQKTTRELVLSCTTDMATQFHIHPFLKIVINGQEQEIPADVGIVAGCMHPLHTHDNTGKIHVESPEKRDFTLADFFLVWNKTYTKDQIFDYKVDDTHVIRQTVNGQDSQEFENLVFEDLDQIVIYYEEKKP